MVAAPPPIGTMVVAPTPGIIVNPADTEPLAPALTLGHALTLAGPDAKMVVAELPTEELMMVVGS